ncbi:citrate lyase subunit alpha / citrate CoA-transferase [Shimia gijangensis]|uniref:Citrate lyase subunit alpha / citrate CoA-transferase n=1 Tax=Shimia gijangensis TaxID=1470563 RepID=A0A1M6AV88_9RHOB|nr:citrate lyase subunit alpha [Shimia gijangensis]SHI40357.1 citrate lyase subunit alpha / citrate CoA-transferase [Shimia gijangensis]
MAALPDYIDGYGPVHAFAGAELSLTSPNPPRPAVNTVFTATLAEAIGNAGLASGSTISFHHHLRNGDDVMRQVLAICQTLGICDLHIAPSSLFPCHASLIPFLADGTVTRITTAYMNGPLADAVKAGKLRNPAVLQTHGGRAHAIESGRLGIDVAFVAAPAVDRSGNLTGAIGPEACGPLGYAMVDAAHAAHVIAVTDHVAESLPRICIPAAQVDQVVNVHSIGAAARIVSGTTGRPVSPKGKIIANLTARLIAASGLLQNGFSFQTGAGATSLAVASALTPVMTERGITGGFAAGGMTGPLVNMHHNGLFRELWDVQAFDLEAVRSFASDAAHHPMSAALYASPARADAIANRLDVMILGAAEVDQSFNVNVTQASDGRIIGGSGGHSDTAAGAKLPIVTTTLKAGGFPKLVSELTCLTTPGDTIGAVVTEAGMAIHPSRPDLTKAALHAGLPVVSIEDLCAQAQRECGKAPRTQSDGRIVAVCEYRDGRVIDVIIA